MDKKEVASRLEEILNRNSDRKVNKLIPEDIRQLNICIAALTITDVVGQSEQLVCEYCNEDAKPTCCDSCLDDMVNAVQKAN